MSQRFSILDQLADNWPGKFPPNRIKLIENLLAEYDTPTVSKGVASVLKTEQWPPVASTIVKRCESFAPKANQSVGKEQLVAGGPVPGRPEETFLSVDAAVEELERMKREFPECFKEASPGIPVGKKLKGEKIQLERIRFMVNRIYIRGLERCIKGGGRPVEALQQSFF